MKRTDYDFSGCMWNPNSEGFLKTIQEIKEFGEYIPPPHSSVLTRKRVFTWIVIMFDLNSPLRRTITNYYDRKKLAAEIAGWERGRNNEFPEEVTQVLLGENETVNKLIVSYLMLFSMPEYTQLIAYLNIQFALMMEAMKQAFDKDTVKLLDDLTTKIKRLTSEIYGSGQVDEVMNARKALYNMAEKERVRLNPESIVKVLSEEGELPKDFNPHGKYKPDKIKFISDEE